MLEKFPFPVAYAYHLIEAARNSDQRYKALLRCYEVIVRYCATVQLSDYVAAGCPDTVLNAKLLERLGRNLSLGHWIELTREVTTLQKHQRLPSFMPEMVEFYFKPGKKVSFTPAATVFESDLCAARNDWAHTDHTWPDQEAENRFRKHKPLLDQLLEALQFLTGYSLYVPEDRPRDDSVSKATSLVGPTLPLPVRHDLNLRLAPQLRTRLESETTAFLVAGDDSDRQLLLYPLSVFARRGEREDIFLFENCELARRDVKSLRYVGFSVGQLPLDIVPGSDYSQLVEEFRSLLLKLKAEGSAPAPEAPVANGLAEHYFQIQHSIIQEHVGRFVGREYVDTALNDFLETHRRGYFLICGGPGQGKTAIASQLVKQRRLVHHLIGPTAERDNILFILRSLVAQIIPYAGAPEVVPDRIPDLAKLFADLLLQAAGRCQKVVLMIDGLDELSADAGEVAPFLVTDALPEGVFYVVTSRLGDRLNDLTKALYGLDHQVYNLGALEFDEMSALLRARHSGLSDAQVESFAEACQGNPLYLLAASDELTRNPHFDPHSLPSSIEGFFHTATRRLRTGESSLGRDVLGLLTVARKPLTLREIAQVTSGTQREVFEQGIRPVRQFLYEIDDGYSCYHASFRDFVARELLYEDEISSYHCQLAQWLLRPESRGFEYRWMSLAHHLFECGDRAGLLERIDDAFLKEKVRRFGYAVLEDVELLTKALLEAGDPSLVARCVALVEGLRKEAGGDLIEDVRLRVQGYRPGPQAFRSRVLTPAVPTMPELDLWAGTLPKQEVGADFFESVQLGDRLVLVLGDAPGGGLKPAFVARFIGNLCRRLLEQDGIRDLGALLNRVNEIVSQHDYFRTVAIQLAEIDPKEELVNIASAGVPYPVLYTARLGRSDTLPISGELLHAAVVPHAHPPSWEVRSAELGPGDVLLLVTDGLTEAYCSGIGGYGYRFTKLVKEMAGQPARAIGEAILDDWRAHPREGDYVDDVTIVVAAMRDTRNPNHRTSP